MQAAAEPVSPRHHNLTDALFVPGAISEPNAIAGVSADAIQIRNRDASTSLSLRESEIMLQVGSSTITVMDGVISLNAGGSTITLGSSVEIQSGGLSHNGKNIGDTHTHSGVTRGQDPTGAPL